MLEGWQTCCINLPNVLRLSLLLVQSLFRSPQFNTLALSFGDTGVSMERLMEILLSDSEGKRI